MLDRRCMVLLVVLTSCSVGDRGAPVDEARQGLAPGFVIGDVIFDPHTYHWATPGQLLASAEGAGPRTLSVVVSDSVSPQISWTGTHTPSHSDLTKALGFSVGKAVTLAAETNVLIPVNAYARIGAYPTFQRATWAIVGFGEIVGTGVSYRPIGVYFDTCGCIGIDPCGSSCLDGFPSSGDAPPGNGSRSGANGKFQGAGGAFDDVDGG